MQAAAESRGLLARFAAVLAVLAVSVFVSGAAPQNARAYASTPSWWSGDCDVNNDSGSYALGATYNGVKACGPGPTQGGTDHLVNFYPGAWGENEWECVELVMRYMYLVYGVAPYSANGNTVVSNYSGSVMNKVSNNGTSLPVAGDIVSENDSPNGHTGVVTTVNVTNGSGTVTIMQENASSDGWGSITVTNNVLGSSVTGWLHYNGAKSYDFTHDGYADLMTLNNDSPNTDVMVLTNTGGSGGLHAPANWYHLGGWDWNGLKSVSGDFNGDGYNDLAILTNDGSGGTDVYVSLNTGGSGGLQAPGLWYDITSMSLSSVDPITGYFTGGRYSGLALLHNDGTGSSFWVMVNNNGSLQAPALWYNLPGWGWSGIIPVSGDFNDDGYTDIATLNNDSPSPTIQMFLNTTGSGGLRAPVNWYTLTGWGWSGLKPFVGDFNHDGYADFGTLNNVTGGTTVQMLLNTGGSGGLKAPAQWYNLVGWGWGGLKPFVGDYNNDGYSDLGTLNNDGSTTDVMMLLNTGGSGGLKTPANWYALTGWGWSGLMLPGE